MGYKIGIIGCGLVAQHHLRGYRHLDDVEVIAVADSNETALRNTKEKWGIENLYSDYYDLLRRNDIDIVDITVPDPLHIKSAFSFVYFSITSLGKPNPRVSGLVK